MERYRSGNSEGNSLPKLNHVFKGEVVTVKDFGAFVKIPGFSKNGLVHVSQLSRCSVDKVTDIVSMGDKVWCKVISIGENDKISLSMKFVDQGDGKDLDPNGVQLSLDDKRKRAFSQHSQKKIQLDAVYNTTCKKCGTKGHLAQDCFHTPGNKTYELLTDEVESNEAQAAISDRSTDAKTKVKKRKYDSDSSSDSNSTELKHKRKKSKHTKKKRSHSKKKRRT